MCNSATNRSDRVALFRLGFECQTPKSNAEESKVFIDPLTLVMINLVAGTVLLAHYL